MRFKTAFGKLSRCFGTNLNVRVATSGMERDAKEACRMPPVGDLAA
jgi:hypothetical protein